MAHGNNIELIEVVFEPITLLIPQHRALQRCHGMGREGPIAGLHVNAQGHVPATGGREGIGHLLQLACHQSKQVGRLGERVIPNGVMAAP